MDRNKIDCKYNKETTAIIEKLDASIRQRGDDLYQAARPANNDEWLNYLISKRAEILNKAMPIEINIIYNRQSDI